MPPPPSVMQGAGMPEQTAFQKLKMGALMGGTVGLTIGFLFGAFSVVTRGAGPNGAMSQISQTMIASGMTFSCFMGIGSVIRTHGGYMEPAEIQAYRESLSRNTTEAVRARLRWRFQEERASKAVESS